MSMLSRTIVYTDRKKYDEAKRQFLIDLRTTLRGPDDVPLPVPPVLRQSKHASSYHLDEQTEYRAAIAERALRQMQTK